MELVGKDQAMFGDMVSELGLAAAMRPEAEYTLLAPLDSVFTGESSTKCYIIKASLFSSGWIWYLVEPHLVTLWK